VDSFILREDAYQPIIVPYNDFCPKTFLDQSKAILKAVGEKCDKPGHALVMIHHLQSRKNHEEDPLAAMVVRELRNRFDLAAAVIHTAVGQECYVLGENNEGEPEYVPHLKQKGKLFGYLQLVAINKVLLLNERWPFVLATPLHADLIIGIDVKHHTAGFILVDSYGERIRSLLKNSAQKERLRDDQTESYLLELIRAEVEAQGGVALRHLVIHRDGRIWTSEIAGIQRAFKRLKRDRILSDDATLTILEIPKTSPCYFRLFSVSENGNGTRVDDPQIGQWEVRGNDGYICSTGRAFPHHGTALPLHVRKIEGPMPMEDCLEDISYLCALAWTKPDDCCRDPITTKLNDRFLGDEATKYDAEVLEYSLSSDGHTDEDEEEASA
jgi:hypothetical protein